MASTRHSTTLHSHRMILSVEVVVSAAHGAMSFSICIEWMVGLTGPEWQSSCMFQDTRAPMRSVRDWTRREWRPGRGAPETTRAGAATPDDDAAASFSRSSFFLPSFDGRMRLARYGAPQRPVVVRERTLLELGLSCRCNDRWTQFVHSRSEKKQTSKKLKQNKNFETRYQKLHSEQISYHLAYLYAL